MKYHTVDCVYNQENFARTIEELNTKERVPRPGTVTKFLSS